MSDKTADPKWRETVQQINREEVKKELSEQRREQACGIVSFLSREDALLVARHAFDAAQAEADDVVEVMGGDDVLVERLLATAHKRLGAERWSELLVSSLSDADIEAHAAAVQKLRDTRVAAKARVSARAELAAPDTEAGRQQRGAERCAVKGHLRNEGKGPCTRCGAP